MPSPESIAQSRDKYLVHAVAVAINIPSDQAASLLYYQPDLVTKMNSGLLPQKHVDIVSIGFNLPSPLSVFTIFLFSISPFHFPFALLLRALFIALRVSIPPLHGLGVSTFLSIHVLTGLSSHLSSTYFSPSLTLTLALRTLHLASSRLRTFSPLPFQTLPVLPDNPPYGHNVILIDAYRHAR